MSEGLKRAWLEFGHGESLSLCRKSYHEINPEELLFLLNVALQVNIEFF